MYQYLIKSVFQPLSVGNAIFTYLELFGRYSCVYTFLYWIILIFFSLLLK
jgi:hypothetical protein